MDFKREYNRGYNINRNNRGRVKEIQKFYNSEKWKMARAEKLNQVGYICERCKKRGIIKAAYIVHHKTYINVNNVNDVDITLNPSNLEALCHPCHNTEHFGGGRFDEFGNLKR